MNLFKGNLKPVAAAYIPVSRNNPLGTVVAAPRAISVIIVESGNVSFTSAEHTHNSRVSIYARPDEIDRTCVGGYIKIDSGRCFRIDGYNLAINHRTGAMEHIRLDCTEQEG